MGIAICGRKIEDLEKEKMDLWEKILADEDSEKKEEEE